VAVTKLEHQIEPSRGLHIKRPFGDSLAAPHESERLLSWLDSRKIYNVPLSSLSLRDWVGFIPAIVDTGRAPAQYFESFVAIESH
jgi:hypothetical protein